MRILNRIPKLEQVKPVYALIVVMIYTWSLILFFWRFPSWLYYLTLGEITGIFSYMVVVNLVESILVLIMPLMLAIILPQKWFYDQFITKGSYLIMFSLGYLMLSYENLINEILSPWVLLQKILMIGLIILALVFLIDKAGFLNKFTREFSNRAIIFLYIWIPISIISLVTMSIRNIF